MKQFVPLIDDLLYDSPDMIAGPVVPYRQDYACLHWLDAEILEERQEYDQITHEE